MEGIKAVEEGLAKLAKFDLVYLGTPYTKYIGGIEAAFEDASWLAGELLLRDIKVYSPIAHTHPIATFRGIDPLKHEIWLPFDEAMMQVCDALIVGKLNGWDESKGVSHEVAHFMESGKPIYWFNPWTLAIDGEVDVPMYDDERADPMRAADILKTAAGIVAGAREEEHGDKMKNFATIAKLWNAYLVGRGINGREGDLSAGDVANLMECMKVARRLSGRFNLDDFIDGAGYAACAGEIALRGLSA